MKLLVFFIFPVIKKQGFQLRVRKGRGGGGGGCLRIEGVISECGRGSRLGKCRRAVLRAHLRFRIRELVTTDSTVVFLQCVKPDRLRVLPGGWPQEEESEGCG